MRTGSPATNARRATTSNHAASPPGSEASPPLSGDDFAGPDAESRPPRDWRATRHAHSRGRRWWFAQSSSGTSADPAASRSKASRAPLAGVASPSPKLNARLCTAASARRKASRASKTSSTPRPDLSRSRRWFRSASRTNRSNASSASRRNASETTSARVATSPARNSVSLCSAGHRDGASSSAAERSNAWYAAKGDDGSTLSAARDAANAMSPSGSDRKGKWCSVPGVTAERGVAPSPALARAAMAFPSGERSAEAAVSVHASGIRNSVAPSAMGPIAMRPRVPLASVPTRTFAWTTPPCARTRSASVDHERASSSAVPTELFGFPAGDAPPRSAEALSPGGAEALRFGAIPWSIHRAAVGERDPRRRGARE